MEMMLIIVTMVMIVMTGNNNGNEGWFNVRIDSMIKLKIFFGIWIRCNNFDIDGDYNDDCDDDGHVVYSDSVC